MTGLLDAADLQKLLDEVIQERDEARQGARFYRDLYVGIVGKTYDEEYRLPWEVEE